MAKLIVDGPEIKEILAGFGIDVTKCRRAIIDFQMGSPVRMYVFTEEWATHDGVMALARLKDKAKWIVEEDPFVEKEIEVTTANDAFTRYMPAQ